MGRPRRMRREWSPEDLIACWTLVESDWDLVANKAGATRLGFAVMIKFFELEARFPRHAGEVPKVAVDYIAEQVGVDAGLFSRYAWSGRTIEYHRAQVRAAMGFRETNVVAVSFMGCSFPCWGVSASRRSTAGGAKLIKRRPNGSPGEGGVPPTSRASPPLPHRRPHRASLVQP